MKISNITSMENIPDHSFMAFYSVIFYIFTSLFFVSCSAEQKNDKFYKFDNYVNFDYEAKSNQIVRLVNRFYFDSENKQYLINESGFSSISECINNKNCGHQENFYVIIKKKNEKGGEYIYSEVVAISMGRESISSDYLHRTIHEILLSKGKYSIFVKIISDNDKFVNYRREIGVSWGPFMMNAGE